jgi:PTH1 family peptidyl-tRNA hydrolase
MNLVVGLGNPGKQYDGTRHNVGFYFLDRLVHEFGLAPFVKSEKFNAEMTRLDDSEHHWFFAKPKTFMNESGVSVGALVKFYRLPLNRLLIIHDDLDLPLGEVRPAFDRGPAGHNGVQSIIETLGGQNFHRLRIGIGSNRDVKLPAEDYVLQRFSKDEQQDIAGATKSVVDFVLKWAT